MNKNENFKLEIFKIASNMQMLCNMHEFKLLTHELSEMHVQCMSNHSLAYTCMSNILGCNTHVCANRPLENPNLSVSMTSDNGCLC